MQLLMQLDSLACRVWHETTLAVPTQTAANGSDVPNVHPAALSWGATKEQLTASALPLTGVASASGADATSAFWWIDSVCLGVGVAGAYVERAVGLGLGDGVGVGVEVCVGVDVGEGVDVGFEPCGT